MADERSKINGALDYLRRLGYAYNDVAQEIIEKCDLWYTGQETDFHKTINFNGLTIYMDTLNFAKRCCEDDANLCEIVNINTGDENAEAGFLEILEANRFDVMYRKQLERLSATGTVGAYIRLDNAEMLDNGKARGGDIKINYVNAVGIVPLTVENDDVIECAFVGYGLNKGQVLQTLVVFTKDPESGLYVASTAIFNSNDQLISEQVVQLGDVKPFAIMRTAEVNNLDDMEGYGLPKIYNAIPALKATDLCWNILHGDLSKGEKLLFINELLAEIKKDADGNPSLTKKQKELFIMLGEKLPDQDSLIKEYNPEIRTQAITEAFELCLSLLSMMFGYGTKRYSFENGQIKTATEYIGERQDAMQELNKQRYEATQYIEDIIHAVIWFSNTFKQTNWSLDDEICIAFDDSYVTDRQSEMESMRADALSFPEVPEFTVRYIMARLNCEREAAIAYIQQEAPEVDELED